MQILKLEAAGTRNLVAAPVGAVAGAALIGKYGKGAPGKLVALLRPPPPLFFHDEVSRIFRGRLNGSTRPPPPPLPPSSMMAAGLVGGAVSGAVAAFLAADLATKWAFGLPYFDRSEAQFQFFKARAPISLSAPARIIEFCQVLNPFLPPFTTASGGRGKMARTSERAARYVLAASS